MAVSRSLDTDLQHQLRRPYSQSGYRFGQLSLNSFFTRHNPHPSRVMHIKGLLDVPICTVNDHGYVASPKYELRFPPYAFDYGRLGVWKNFIPASAININSQRLPLDTISGLQNFTGLHNVFIKEKAIPRIGLVPDTERWKEELLAFTNALSGQKHEQKPVQSEKKPQTRYSETTGRLIPPPSRAMSRQASRGGATIFPPMEHISANPDIENTVFSMLCQILQTDNVGAVQSWLCNAPEREKQWMLDLIQSTLQAKVDYYNHNSTRSIQKDERPHTTLPLISNPSETKDRELQTKVDRLVLDKKMETINEENVNEGQNTDNTTTNSAKIEQILHKMENDVPGSSKENQSGRKNKEIRLRYTQTPDRISKTEKAMKNMGVSEWHPHRSLTA